MDYYINLLDDGYEISSKPGRTVCAIGWALEDLEERAEVYIGGRRLTEEDLSGELPIKLGRHDIVWDEGFEPIRTPDNYYIIHDNSLSKAKELGYIIEESMGESVIYSKENIINELYNNGISLYEYKEYYLPSTPWYSRVSNNGERMSLLEKFEIEVLIYRALSRPEIAERMYEIEQDFGYINIEAYRDHIPFVGIEDLIRLDDLGYTMVEAMGVDGVFVYYTFYMPNYLYEDLEIIAGGDLGPLRPVDKFLQSQCKEFKRKQNERIERLEAERKRVSEKLRNDEEFQKEMAELFKKAKLTKENLDSE